MSFQGLLVEKVLAADDAGPDIRERVLENVLSSRLSIAGVSSLTVHPSHVPT